MRDDKSGRKYNALTQEKLTGLGQIAAIAKAYDLPKRELPGLLEAIAWHERQNPTRYL